MDNRTIILPDYDGTSGGNSLTFFNENSSQTTPTDKKTKAAETGCFNKKKKMITAHMRKLLRT